MKATKSLIYITIIFYSFSMYSCVDESFIIEREAKEKQMLKASQIVKATPPTILGKLKNIKSEECNTNLLSRMDNIIDVRTMNTYGGNHIKGAINIPLSNGDFIDHISYLDKTKKYLIYGGGNNESGKAAKIMQAIGFLELYNLQSSIDKCTSISLSTFENVVNKNLNSRFNDENSNVSFLKGLGNTTSIVIEELNNYKTEKDVFVDIRSVQEFVNGHIEGALHVDWKKYGFIEQVLNSIPSDKNVVLYDNNNGIDGNNAMVVLQALGFPNVYYIENGLTTYKQAGIELIPLEIKGDPLHLSEDEFAKAIVGELGTIIDVRTMGEYDIAHIPKSILIDVKKNTFEGKLSELDINTPIFLYCKTGIRSRKASKIAKKLGYNVFNLDHGFKGWLKHHKPIIGEAHSIDNGEEGC